MTTPRTRRTSREQAGDILERLYVKQMEKAGRDKVRWEQSVADAERTKAALTVLGVAMSYAMDTPVQPIGGKAQCISEMTLHIDDVWSEVSSVIVDEVHSPLMYARQDSCGWCRRGVPFATAKRTEHHLVIRNAAGDERGFENKPCMSAKE